MLMLRDDDSSSAGRRDRRIGLGLFVVVAVCYGYFFGGGGWNQNAHFDLTRALVEQRTVAIDAYKDNTYDVSFDGDHVYANKSPGISLLATIPYVAARAVESAWGLDASDPLVMTLNAWICTFVICGLLGASIPMVLYFYGRRALGVSPRDALAVALVIALGTPLFAYSSVMFLHVPSAALLLMAFVLTSAFRGSRPALAGGFAGLAGLCNYLCIPAAAILLGFSLLFEGPRWKRAATFLTAAAPAALVLLVYQQIAFGSPLKTPIDTTSKVFLDEHAFLGIVRFPSTEAAWGITFSRFRGLFYLSPVLLFCVAGAWILWKGHRKAAEVVTVAGIALFFFGFNTTFNGWDGGSAIGPRYVLPVVPLLGVLMLVARPRARWVWLSAAALSFAVNFAAVAVNPIPSHTIKDPIGSYIAPLLVSGRLPADVPEYPPWAWKSMLGHVSVNRHAIDEFVPFTRHPLGSLEAEWASFNVGEALAPGSVLSLIPLLAWICGGTLVLWRLAEPSATEDQDSGAADVSG